MRIDLKFQEKDLVSIDVPETVVSPGREDVSTVPLICGFVIGMVLPFGMMACMRYMLSIKYFCGVEGLWCETSPVCIVCLVAIIVVFVVTSCGLYLIWKKWCMENSRKRQKQSMEFVAGIVNAAVNHEVSLELTRISKPT